MPYISNSETDVKVMLEKIGLAQLQDLFLQIPQAACLKSGLELPAGMSEFEVKTALTQLAEKNIPLNKFNAFLGAGCYDNYVPAALTAILSKPEFFTAYTPYQPEASQGALQAIYEYQSYICLLTGMDVSNASVFDGGTALAESVLAAIRATNRQKVLIASSINPQYRKTLETYLYGLNIKIQEIDFSEQGFLNQETLKKKIDNKTACLAIQNPNFFGLIEEVEGLSEIVHAQGALMVSVVNPQALALLKEPVKSGVDIVCGDGQPLGCGLNFGGPSFGFMATKNEYLRQLPGRIVGRTSDKSGRQAFCLTMQAREQHIRREKATSNICSNQSLCAIAAAVYLALMGKVGFRAAALSSLEKTRYLYDQLAKIPQVKVCGNPRFFNEFFWTIDGAKKIIDKLYRKKIVAGYWLGKDYRQLKNAILSCCTEKKSITEIDQFIAALKNEIGAVAK